MKKIFIKYISIIIAFILLFPFTGGCGCNGDDMAKEQDYEAYDPDAGIDRNTVLDDIVKDNGTEYRIVYPVSGSATEKYAAQELQYFIMDSTGVKLPVITDGAAAIDNEKLICIGRTALTAKAGISPDTDKFGSDGFVLKTEGKNLHIIGGGDRGTLYGVYDWLEKIIGIRFLDSDVTYVPKLDGIKLYAMDVTEIPYFEYRGFLSTATMYGYGAGADPAFYARTRNNHEHILQHVVNLDAKYGGTIKWYSKINPTHNTLNYVSTEKYFDKNTGTPKAEYRHMYAAQGVLSGGTWDICFTDGLTDDGKLDTTMENSALKAAVESLKSYVLDDSDCYYMFGHMDTGEMCNCERCMESHRKYGMTGTYFRFANALLTEVQKWADTELNGKQIKLVIFAYSASEEAPVKVNTETGVYEIIDESVRPLKNIYVRLAPIHSNRYFSMGEGKHITKYKDWLEKWTAVSDNFMVWAYTVDFHRSMWYFPTHQSIVKTLTEYKALGVKYMMLQAIWQEKNDWQSIMKNYVYTKLLWNPYRDVNALIKEFCVLYYGETASEYVLKMMDIYDQYFYLAVMDSEGDFTSNYTTFTNPLYNKYEYVYAGYEQIETALRLVSEDNALTEDQKQAYIRRLKVVKLTPLFMIAYNGDNYFIKDSVTKKRWIEDFVKLSRELGVIYIGENTGSQTEFLFDNFIKDYWGYKN